MARNRVVIDVKLGPTLRTALDVMDLVGDLIADLPEWHPDRAELRERAEALIERVERELHAQG